MTRTQLLSVFFIALLLFILYNTLLILSPFFRPIFWAAVLSFGFYPLYEKLAHVFGARKGLAAAVTAGSIFLLFVPVFIFVVFNVAHEAVKLYHQVTLWIKNGDVARAMAHVRSLDLVKGFESLNLLSWELIQNKAENWLLSSVGTIGNFTLRQVVMVTKNMAAATLNFLLTFFLAFFFLRDGGKIYGFLYEITPLEEENKKAIFSQIIETFSAVLRGQLLTSFIQGITSGIIFWLLGLPLPIFFAAVTFLSSLVPVLGAASVWLPLVFYLAVIQSYTKAAILFLCGTLIISLIDNLLKPWVIGEKTKLPYLLLFLGILGGIKSYGLMGIFLAPAVLSLFFALIKIYREKYLRETAS